MNQHFPRKRFAQHFLINKQIIQAIIAAIAPQPQQHLVEIGPGKGALTFDLLQSDCFLDLIELDYDLIAWLKQKLPENEKIRIYQADVLKFDFKILQRNLPLRIVGNLPYNISTPLLFHLAKYRKLIQNMVFMLQKEVVDRIIASPATSQYGRLSVMVQFYYQAEQLFNVNPDAFYPPPKVHSSIIQLIPHQIPPVQLINPTHFEQIVTISFAQRRKMIRNNLKKHFTVQEIELIGINPEARPETLTLEQFAQLANAFSKKS
ncbi:MAG: 16S rRNA (adenine(1518)-N(6)/adenine(1519)-N(6))-dimethyltransferase RsmA [Thiomargarita sp.]|nr:16S rRNA (adenine(1518)-N(6)/adenine(1519)-N(6))-dimethyltransferase RsmA [Thiomargarita sp.]